MRIVISLLLLANILITVSSSGDQSQSNKFEDFAVGLLSNFKKNQDQAKDGKSLFGFERELGSLWQNPVTCGVCRTGMDAVDWFFSQKATYKAMEKIITYGCSFYLHENVCAGAITSMGDVLIPQITKMLFTGKYACSRFFGTCSTPQWRTINSEGFVRRIIADKPEVIKNNDYIDNLYKQIKNDTKRDTIRIMHMSDLHIDFEYTEGNNKNCGEPLCCMKVNGPAPTPEDAAGKFGEYNCDTSPALAESFFKFVKNMENGPELVLWTGDNVKHDIWNQTNEKNARATEIVLDFMREHWPSLPVFLTTGNHEFYPVNVNSFDPNDQPVLKLISEHLQGFMDQDAIEQFSKYGYCSIPMKSISEKFDKVRVITLNTQPVNDMNWGLLSELNDPGHQLMWLEKEFRDMEAKGELAILLGHIVPTGGVHDWAIRYKTLVERFQHVIRFQAFGHYHTEKFYIVRGTYDFKPLSSYFLAGSLTPYTDLNPGFKIMEFDKETMLPIKMHSYFVNLTKANLEKEVTWEHAYEMTEEYGLPDLSPSSLYNFTNRIFEEPDLAVKYLKNSRQNSPATAGTTCDLNCQFSMRCDMSNVEGYLSADCNGSPHIDYLNDLRNLNYQPYIFEPWVEQVDG